MIQFSGVLLVGHWPVEFTAHLDRGHQVSSERELRRLRRGGKEITWLLVESAGSGALGYQLIDTVGSWPSRPHVAVRDVPGTWAPSTSCDVYLGREAAPEELSAAMLLVQRGYETRGGSLRIPAGTRRPTAELTSMAELTDREVQLLEALTGGLGNDQIARRMGISRRTVEFHCTRLFRKLGVSSRVEAALAAQRFRLGPPGGRQAAAPPAADQRARPERGSVGLGRGYRSLMLAGTDGGEVRGRTEFVDGVGARAGRARTPCPAVAVIGVRARPVPKPDSVISHR